MDTRSLLQGILDAPEDDEVRLVYSDWLEDHGDLDRAEFIRAQIQLARITADDPNRDKLRERADRLLSAHHTEWVKDVPGWARHEVRFVRGFIRDVVCTADSFIKRGGRLFENAPVRGIRLTKYAGRIAEVTLTPHAQRVTAITLYTNRCEERLTREDIPALAESVWPATLESLDLTGNWLGRAEVEILTRTEFPRLHTLILNHNYLRQEGLRVLLEWPSLRHVRRLGLAHNVFRTIGMGPIDEMIRQSPNLEALLDLEITGAIDSSSLAALTDTPTLGGLQSLNLSHNRLDDTSCALLANTPYLTRLRTLDLASNHITAEGVETLIRSPRLHSPCRVSLLFNRIGDSSIESLRHRLIERFGLRCVVDPQRLR